MNHKVLFSLIAFSLQLAVSAQYFSGKKDVWKNRRQSLSIGIGFSNFLGELGGRDQIGSDFIYDLEWSETRPSLQAAYRYQLGSRFYAKAQFAFAIVGGNDALTKEIFRRNRNLNFRSAIFELTAQVEFDVVQFGQNNQLYNALKRNRHTSAIYLTLGAGAVRFNPKGNLSGTYYSLKPLNTEGQGFEDGPEEYSLFSFVIPMGIGYRFDINNDWSVCAEIVHRVTFTDYMDDASTVYYDNELIQQTNGELAAYFADPSLGYYVDEDTGDRVPLNSTFTGAQRGDPADNDAYFTVMFKGIYTLPYKRYTRGRGRSVKRRKRKAVF